MPSHHFGNAGPAANIRLYISTAQALLLHAKLNRTNRIGCIDLEGLCFISIHESGQYVQFVAFRVPGLTPASINASIRFTAARCSALVLTGWICITAFVIFLRYVDFVVLPMGTKPLDHKNLIVIVDGHN